MCRVVVRLSKHLAVPPNDFVRSPGQMEFGEGPISARSPTRNRCRRASCPSTKGSIAGTSGSGWAVTCIGFQPSQSKFRQWSSLSGSYGLRDVLGPSLHHASSAFEKIAPEISPLDASNSMRQRRLRDLLGLLRIGAPVPERASETKWNLLNTRFPEQLARIGIRHDRPVPDGDADLDPSAFSSDSLRISSTLSLNLIRCSRDAFILASSTIRLPRRRSTSSHFEPLGIVPRSTSETPNTA